MIDTTLTAVPDALPERDTWAEEYYPDYAIGDLTHEERREGMARLIEVSLLIGSVPDFMLSMCRSILARPDGSSRFVLETLRTL